MSLQNWADVLANPSVYVTVDYIFDPRIGHSTHHLINLDQDGEVFEIWNLITGEYLEY